jgi:rhodanese-related sulfurtransferase
MRTLVALSVALFVAATAYAGEFENVSIKDLKSAMKDKKVVLLDANGTSSWSKAHIPGALDFEANKGKLAEVLPKDKDTLVVAYCGGPQCSAYQAAAKEAKKLGYSNVKHLSAGISGWKEAGEKTEGNKSST